LRVCGEGARQQHGQKANADEVCAAHVRLLKEDKQAEEEDPEDSHGMPVPGGAVD
jgi:hypothetical protein